MQGGQGLFQGPGPCQRGRSGVNAPLPPAVGHGQAEQEPVPGAVEAHGAREHVPVQGQGGVLAVKPGAGHAAPRPSGAGEAAEPAPAPRFSRKALPSSTCRRLREGVWPWSSRLSHRARPQHHHGDSAPHHRVSVHQCHSQAGVAAL